MPAKQTKSQRAKLRSIAAKKGWQTRRGKLAAEYTKAIMGAPWRYSITPRPHFILSHYTAADEVSPKPQSVFLDALQWLPRLKAWLRRMVGK